MSDDEEADASQALPSVREQVETRMREVGMFIRQQRNQAQLSLRKLAEQAGVSNPYLSQIERGMRHPSAEILQAIARALRISAETLYVRAGILEARDSEDEDLTLCILRDRFIDDSQKQALIRVYEAFRTENGGPRVGDPAGGQETAPASA